MLTRADILERFGLPDRPAFEMEPQLDIHGVWRIRVCHEDERPIFMSPGHLLRLAGEIRSVDPHLAEQIDACLEELDIQKIIDRV